MPARSSHQHPLDIVVSESHHPDDAWTRRSVGASPLRPRLQAKLLTTLQEVEAQESRCGGVG